MASIFAFTDKPGTRKAMTLLWGVVPVETQLLIDMESNIKETIQLLKVSGCLKLGDLILTVCDYDVSCSSEVMPTIQAIQIITIV